MFERTRSTSLFHEGAAYCGLRRCRSHYLFGVIAFLELITSSHTLGQASIRNLGDLPGGSLTSGAFAISADGRSFGGFGSPVNLGNMPVIWRDGGEPLGLGYLTGGNEASGYTISADGVWIGGYGNGLNADKSLGFLWSADTGMFSVGDLAGGKVRSFVWGVSAGGRVAAGASDSTDGSEAFRWTPGSGMIGLGFLPGSGRRQSSARAVSASGDIIVGYSNTASEAFAFRWTDAQGMTALPFLPNGPMTERRAFANDISANGDWICGYTSEEWQDGSITRRRDVAVRWGPDGSVTRLGLLPDDFGSYSRAYGISDDGRVIVGDSAGDPFIWTPETGIRNLTEYALGLGLDVWKEGFQLFRAYDVSANGNVLTGQSYIFENNSFVGACAFALTVPTPSAGVILVGAAFGTTACRRRRAQR